MIIVEVESARSKSRNIVFTLKAKRGISEAKSSIPHADIICSDPI